MFRELLCRGLWRDATIFFINSLFQSIVRCRLWHGLWTTIHQIWQTYELDTNQTPRHTHTHTAIHIYTRHTHTHTAIHIYTRPYTYTHYQTRPYTYTNEIPTMFTSHYSTQRFCGSHLTVFPPPVSVQNTICSNTRSCSPGDGHNDARNMLR